MRKVFSTALSLTLAIVMAFLGAAQVFADSQKTYVSEVKVAMGDSAENDLTNEGFTVLCDENGAPIDLNQDAGGGKYSQGDKKVLMGYKTTTNVREAVTDLAVMNMKGGYSVEEYDLLMKRYMGAQISPFIDKFLVTIEEYRENLESDDDANRARAEYARAALNRFTDDDCGGAGLGDLLVNETVYEMAKPQYDALTDKQKEETGISGVNEQVRESLSESERKEHCDLLTLFAQADGQILLSIYALLTRAADTSDDSWLDRFSCMTFDDLLDSYDMAPTDARKRAAKDFQDDAWIILQGWDTFREYLLAADDNYDALDDMEVPDVEGVEQAIEAGNNAATDEELLEAAAEVYEFEAQKKEFLDCAASVAMADYLEDYAYGDETMLDFFTRDSRSVSLEELYPLVASLSPGQRAGLEFLSLRELAMASNREAEYDTESVRQGVTSSVYEGVDRGIYAKGGVGLTSDALRTDALKKQKNLADRSVLSTKTIALWAVTGVCAVGFVASFITYKRLASKLSDAKFAANSEAQSIEIMNSPIDNFSKKWVIEDNPLSPGEQVYVLDSVPTENPIGDEAKLVEGLSGSTSVAKWLSVGFAAATFIITGISAYMTWKDLTDYYKVDYSPIPHYMVDETSITYTNERGEKLVKPNQAAYYEAVTCNRKESDKNYKALGNCADLNGDVGQQWLALYACRNYQEMQPILADSFKVVVGSDEIPAGYSNVGIHMFGSESAFNLNNKLYDWNQSAKSVFVYFQVDETAPVGEASTSGSAFSAGISAVCGVGGAGLGALVTALAMTANNKKKGKKAATT